MEPDDIQRELDQVWQRVNAPPDASMMPPSPGISFALTDAPTITREVSLEAISLIKRQHRSELLRLQQYIELKERSVRELSDRLAAAESEVQHLRARSQSEEQRVYQEVLGASVELENARKAVQLQEERFAQEEAVLRGIAEQTRRQLAAETSRWHELERQWGEREQQYLLEIRELQARAQHAQEDSAQNESRSRRSMEELAEAKGAIERTLAELLQERADREAADKERDKALGRVKEVEDHVRALQNLWEEERKQWQELWDRERSTWESQRQEFAKWEEKVRAEREAWHANLQSVESRETKYAEQMADILRKSAEAGEKVGAMVRLVSDKARELVTKKGEVAAAAATSVPRDWRKALWAGAAALVLAASVPVWRYATRLVLKPISSHAVMAGSPTGLAYDGTALWMSGWEGDIYALDPQDPSRILSRVSVEKAAPYHPVSLALWAGSLYSLDTAQGRVLRHLVETPGKVDSQWQTPGPAPIALAHDGRNLWSYDAASRALYRHLGEGRGAQAEAYKVELDILPVALAWYKETIWLYDAKSKQIMLFKVRGRSLQLVKAVETKAPVQAMVLVPRSRRGGRQELELWMLSPAAGTAGPTLKKFVVRGGDIGG